MTTKTLRMQRCSRFVPSGRAVLDPFRRSPGGRTGGVKKKAGSRSIGGGREYD